MAASGLWLLVSGSLLEAAVLWGLGGISYLFSFAARAGEGREELQKDEAEKVAKVQIACELAEAYTPISEEGNEPLFYRYISRARETAAGIDNDFYRDAALQIIEDLISKETEEN